MTYQVQLFCRHHENNLNASLSVPNWYSSPLPCSSLPKSKDGRGDGGLRAFVSSNAIFGSKIYHRKNENNMEFAPTSLLPWGEEQDEGVSCLRGGAHA